MPRYAYLIILGLGVLGLWLWQGESVQEVVRDTISPSTTDSPEGDSETQRQLTPEERSAYIAAVNRALHERFVVYKGRLRLGGDLFGSPMFRVAYVPIPLVSVQCDLLGVRVRGPGAEGGEVSPPSMSLFGLTSPAEDRALLSTVMKALDRADLLDEVCRIVIDELDARAANRYGYTAGNRGIYDGFRIARTLP